MKNYSKVLLIAGALALTSCAAPQRSGQVYYGTEAQTVNQIRYATVVSVRPVTIQSQATGTGALAGGVAGAAVGSQIGGGNGRIVAGVLGAIAGAAVGKSIEEGGQATAAWEFVLRVKNSAGYSEDVSIVQPQDGNTFFVGQSVKLIGSGSKTRVSP